MVRREKEYLPPFIKTDEAITIHVNLFKEASKSPLGDCKTRLTKG